MPERGGDESEAADRFLVDAMCGSLATYLRMCGYDAAYAPERGVEGDDAVLALARAEDRLLVTRDVTLGERVEDAIVLASRDVRDQLETLAGAGIRLELPDDPSRCSACNGRLARVSRETSTPEDAPAPAERPVWRCGDCGQHLWRGSHWDDVTETLGAL